MSNEKRSFLLRYRDRNNNIKDSVVPIPEEDYRENFSYEENLQDIVRDMFNEGGFWIDENTIVPFHMVLSIERHDEKNKKENEPKNKPEQDNKRKDRRFFRHRSKNKYSNATSSNQVTSNGNNGQPKPDQPVPPKNPV